MAAGVRFGKTGAGGGERGPGLGGEGGTDHDEDLRGARSLEARPERTVGQHGGLRGGEGWPVRRPKRTKTAWTLGGVRRGGVLWEVGHELDADAREGRVGGPGGHEEEGGRGGGGSGEGVGVAERGVDGGGEGGAEDWWERIVAAWRTRGGGRGWG
ncbi:glycine-rich cell wall structural protein 1.8-like [Syzygium oleosum]|uniref:glycine-rich cell wall structural protein 1.8-like n=1 Tax=Syzygium oleosum TaxID=219896 RepID=UPI0024B94C5D|nr:glycine-rich cell wall structural protein 1.8-like [Syzygium oleosum]